MNHEQLSIFDADFEMYGDRRIAVGEYIPEAGLTVTHLGNQYVIGTDSEGNRFGYKPISGSIHPMDEQRKPIRRED